MHVCVCTRARVRMIFMRQTHTHTHTHTYTHTRTHMRTCTRVPHTWNQAETRLGWQEDAIVHYKGGLDSQGKISIRTFDPGRGSLCLAPYILFASSPPLT